MGAYGHVRGTNDLDIFIHSTDQNANRIMDACIEYGISKNDLKKEMFLVPKMIGIGDPPLRIEILKTVGSFDFDYAFKRKLIRNIDGVNINVVDLDDLILLKKAAIKERTKARDQEDLSFLQKLKIKLTKK